MSDHSELPFETISITDADAIPPADERSIDVALLDMNHAWPNMGHNSLIQVVRETSIPFRPFLDSAGLRIRVMSFDVRRSLAIPPPPGRFLLYIGTGGPGEIDPNKNDGVSESSQGIDENPSWEKPLGDLFDAICSDDRAALFAVCHTFGLLCRWSGVAEAVLRPPSKGGKSTGLQQNLLTDAGVAHPWFRRFSGELADTRRFQIIDNRLFDLLPRAKPSSRTDLVIVAREVAKGSTVAGEGITAIEFARDRGGVMPRVFGVNHHPEVIDRQHALYVLGEIFARGEVTAEWYEERARTLTQEIEGTDVENLLRLTSQYMLLLPLQFQLARLIRERREARGLTGNFHEEQLLRDFAEAEEVPV